MERAGNDFTCLPLCSFLTLLWVKTHKYFFSWAAEARDMQRHHTRIMCILGLLTYPWGAQPCARVSPVKSIKGWCHVEQEVSLLCGQLLEVQHWQGSGALEGVSGVWGPSCCTRTPLTMRGSAVAHWPSLTNWVWLGKVSLRRVEIRFHRKVCCKVDDKWCSGWSHVQALSPSTACFFMWFLISPWKVCINFVSPISRRKQS